jgi:hypothetical protein
VFGEVVGAGSGFTAPSGTDPGGYQIPSFPNQFGSTQFGGGISLQTADNYGALIGPFKAGFPTVATVVAEIVDVFGDVVTTATATKATLQLSNIRPNAGWQEFPWQQDGIATAINGRLEWSGLQINGIAGTTLTLTVRHSTLATCGCAVQVSLQGGFPTNVTFATQNSNASGAERLYPGAEGPFAVPGIVSGLISSPNTPVIGGYSGSLTNIVVGTSVAFPYSDPGYNSIAAIISDAFGNLASFSTEATISLIGGNPPVDPVKTPVIGNVATSVVTWGLGYQGREFAGVPSAGMPGIARTLADLNQAALGTAIPLTLPPYSTGSASANIAGIVSPALGASGVGYPPVGNPQLFNNVVTFPNFQVLGATSSNVSLRLDIKRPRPILTMIPVGDTGVYFLGTSAVVSLLPGTAVGIAPVLIPDIYNRNLPSRIPSRFYIGRSNRTDPRTWFYLQAVDQFGNRADRGVNAYNGGVANITFYAPEQGLPRAAGATANRQFPPNGFQFSDANDPNVKANKQRYSATGTSAVAVNGLYTFKDFTPLGPVSLDPMGNDVVLTFEDVNLPGRVGCRYCFTGIARPLFAEQLPVTTATTTFLAVPRVSLSIPEAGQEGAATNGSVRAAENVLVMRERSPTFLGVSEQRDFQKGAVRVQRPVTAMSNDIAVGYTLRYMSLDSTLRSVTNATSFVRTPRTFDLPNIGSDSASLPAPIRVPLPFTAPVFSPPLPAPMLVRINGLQGDLSPITQPSLRPRQIVNVVPEQIPGTFFLDQGVSSQLVQFTARWSDQVWSRTPARQGLRAAILALRNPDSFNATVYEIDRTTGKDSAFVYLLDPVDKLPVVLNAIQDKIWKKCACSFPFLDDKIELESPQWRPDNVPGFIFFDDDYDRIVYSVTAEDATQVSGRISQSDPMFAGRPALFYAVQPGADTSKPWRITVRAFDGTTQEDGSRRFATDDFLLYPRPNLTSVANARETKLSISPNPAGASNEATSVHFTLPEAADVRITVFSLQGTQVMSIHAGLMPSGEQRISLPVAQLSPGVYAVRLVAGGVVRTVMMTVIR